MLKKKKRGWEDARYATSLQMIVVQLEINYLSSTNKLFFCGKYQRDVSPVDILLKFIVSGKA